MNRQAPWSLPKLLDANRNAATVFAALLYIADERRRIGPTRATIKTVCGLSERLIGAAIEALHQARWLSRTYFRDKQIGRKTPFRILLPANSLLLWYQNRHTGNEKNRVSCSTKNDIQDKGEILQKTTHRKTVSCGTKNDTHPHKGIGAVPAAAPLPSGDGAAAPAHPRAETGGEHPSARIERERMATIRAARKRENRQPICEGSGAET